MLAGHDVAGPLASAAAPAGGAPVRRRRRAPGRRARRVERVVVATEVAAAITDAHRPRPRRARRPPDASDAGAPQPGRPAEIGETGGAAVRRRAPGRAGRGSAPGSSSSSSTSVISSCSAARAREVWLLTVPSAMPRSCAVSATDSPSQCRSTTVLRCISGSRCRAATRSSLVATSVPLVLAVVTVEAAALAAPRPAGLVDGGAGDGPADVGVLVGGPADPRPDDVQLGQRGLHDVVGARASRRTGCRPAGAAGVSPRRRTPRTRRRAGSVSRQQDGCGGAIGCHSSRSATARSSGKVTLRLAAPPWTATTGRSAYRSKQAAVSVLS